MVKNLPVNDRDARDVGLIPGLGRCPREGNGNPLQYCCLESPMDRGAWWATAHGVTRVRYNLVTKSPPGGSVVRIPGFHCCVLHSIPGWGPEIPQAASSVQFSRSVVSDSLRPRGLQHARPPCPSPTPGVYSDSCPLSQ